MSRKSIFDLEKRFDLDSEFSKLVDDYLLRQRIDAQLSGYTSYFYSLSTIIDATILACPFVAQSRNFAEYLEEYGINEKPSPEKELYMCEFLCNYISWLGNEKIICDFSTRKDSFTIINILNHLLYIIEKLNYKLIIVETDEFDFTARILVKRDADVDSVLHFVENEVRLDLLSYLDFKNENDLDEKMNILRRLYIDLESRKKELCKEPNKRLYSDTTALLNNVRHHRNDFTTEDMMKNCDLAFYHYIHLMRANYLYENKNLIDELKKKNN